MNEYLNTLIKAAIGNRSQNTFARECGLDSATITRIVKNGQRPTPETLRKISSNAQNHVTYSALMTACGYMSPSMQGTISSPCIEDNYATEKVAFSISGEEQTISVPIYNTNSFSYAASNRPIEYYDIPQKDGGSFFGLKISDDSMSPRIQKNDIVIVREQTDVHDGDIVIVELGSSDILCRKIKFHENGMMLTASRPDLSPLFFTHEETAAVPVTIIGKVVELHCTF